ncbi:hypothetical protein [Thioclava pacifica]|uniref:Uncharacterized protein n=1 Tax=Thioclava pacifica DSM 10166 TaxID=1353537 RepID=A0A074JFT7_9RHOB|nr:hypothetical protein [Thioclava pacifica]KEO55379.1 hypothetical protein TP2_15135 [Thioclava pacifica DSM 10166]
MAIYGYIVPFIALALGLGAMAWSNHLSRKFDEAHEMQTQRKR